MVNEIQENGPAWYQWNQADVYNTLIWTTSVQTRAEKGGRFTGPSGSLNDPSRLRTILWNTQREMGIQNLSKASCWNNTPGQRKAKLFIKSSKKRVSELLLLNKKGPLLYTGHCPLKYYQLGQTDNATSEAVHHLTLSHLGLRLLKPIRMVNGRGSYNRSKVKVHSRSESTYN